MVLVAVEEVEVLREDFLVEEEGTSRWERRGDSSLRTIGLIEGEAVQDVEEEVARMLGSERRRSVALLFWLFEVVEGVVSMSCARISISRCNEVVGVVAEGVVADARLSRSALDSTSLSKGASAEEAWAIMCGNVGSLVVENMMARTEVRGYERFIYRKGRVGWEKVLDTCQEESELQEEEEERVSWQKEKGSTS